MNPMHQKKSRYRKLFLKIGAGIFVLGIFVFLLFKFSPWPSALLIRYYFEKDAAKTNEHLEKHVPLGVVEVLDLHYDIKDKDAFLDVYYPSEISESGETRPLVVWVHGGGWVSGSKEEVRNYCKIVASYGYVVAAIDYSLAPEKKYPIPVRQTNAALKFLKHNAGKFHVDDSIFFLAGDSAGSHIAAQTANVISDPEYAELLGVSPGIQRSQLAGLVLFCGAYDMEIADLKGDFGSFLNTVLWSYSGTKEFARDPFFKTGSVIDYIGKNFPPSFISAGNADPLLPQSKALVQKLHTLNVALDTLFFPSHTTPGLPHEYQFNLDNEAGKTALRRMVEFLKKRSGNEKHRGKYDVH